ncbi:MAG: hypothetical protein KAT05_04975 [Spirochaetes bacterium]|nr:hypothetical protein [Spirochaetota bacterium]
MKRIIILILIIFNFINISAQEDKNNFKKAHNITIGIDINTKYSFIFYKEYSEFPYLPDNFFENNISFKGRLGIINLGIPFSYVYYLNPKIGIGFSVNLIFFDTNMIFNTIGAYNEFSSDNLTNNAFSYTVSLQNLFKIKSGNKNNRFKFINELGPIFLIKISYKEISYEVLDLFGSGNKNYYDEYLGLDILAGPYFFTGFEYHKNNFSLEFGGFVNGLFGVVYFAYNNIFWNNVGDFLEKDNEKYVIEFGLSLKLNYFKLIRT